MRSIQKFQLAWSLLIAIIRHASASDVVVITPMDRSTVGSPFELQARSSTCKNQPVATMTYSIGHGKDFPALRGSSLHLQISLPEGPHQDLRVKSWGEHGASCVTDVIIEVRSSENSNINAGGSPPSNSGGPSIPSGALSSLNAENLQTWNCMASGPSCNHDPGTPGYSTGSSSMTSSPSREGNPSREFKMHYQNWGGEIFHSRIAVDPNARSFVYENWVWIPDGNTGSFGNLEMDLNQVIPNGDTVIFGFQCDGGSGTWDYTQNAGTREKHKASWVHSKAACNPSAWPKNTWNHVQIVFSRDQQGNVTYQSVWFNGQPAFLNVTVPSAFSLKWARGVLLLNFQIDGGDDQSGDIAVYSSGVNVYRW